MGSSYFEDTESTVPIANGVVLSTAPVGRGPNDFAVAVD